MPCRECCSFPVFLLPFYQKIVTANCRSENALRAGGSTYTRHQNAYRRKGKNKRWASTNTQPEVLREFVERGKPVQKMQSGKYMRDRPRRAQVNALALGSRRRLPSTSAPPSHTLCSWKCRTSLKMPYLSRPSLKFLENLVL